MKIQVNSSDLSALLNKIAIKYKDAEDIDLTIEIQSHGISKIDIDGEIIDAKFYEPFEFNIELSNLFSLFVLCDGFQKNALINMKVDLLQNLYVQKNDDWVKVNL